MPIDIDNTDVSQITIDGQDVQEVTADGNIVFLKTPDSGYAKYDLEQNVNDSWNNFDATLNGGIYTTDSKVGTYALRMTNDEIDTPIGQNFFDNSAFTVALWVKKNDSDTGNTNEGLFSYDQRTLGISYNDRINDEGFEMINENEVGATVNNVNFGLGSFVHLAITYDGSTARFYANGNYKGGYSYNINGNSSSSTLGYSPAGFSGNMNDATIDDVRFYTKQLSGTELNNLINNGRI